MARWLFAIVVRSFIRPFIIHREASQAAHFQSVPTGCTFSTERVASINTIIHVIVFAMTTDSSRELLALAVETYGSSEEKGFELVRSAVDVEALLALRSTFHSGSREFYGSKAFLETRHTYHESFAGADMKQTFIRLFGFLQLVKLDNSLQEHSAAIDHMFELYSTGRRQGYATDDAKQHNSDSESGGGSNNEDSNLVDDTDHADCESESDAAPSRNCDFHDDDFKWTTKSYAAHDIIRASYACHQPLDDLVALSQYRLDFRRRYIAERNQQRKWETPQLWCSSVRTVFSQDDYSVVPWCGSQLSNLTSSAEDTDLDRQIRAEDEKLVCFPHDAWISDILSQSESHPARHSLLRLYRFYPCLLMVLRPDCDDMQLSVLIGDLSPPILTLLFRMFEAGGYREQRQPAKTQIARRLAEYNAIRHGDPFCRMYCAVNYAKSRSGAYFDGKFARCLAYPSFAFFEKAVLLRDTLPDSWLCSPVWHSEVVFLRAYCMMRGFGMPRPRKLDSLTQLQCAIDIYPNHARALNFLALAIDEGHATDKKDTEAALPIYRRAAAANSPAAPYNLALCCKQNEVGRKYKLNMQAAEAGFGPAFNNLATLAEYAARLPASEREAADVPPEFQLESDVMAACAQSLYDEAATHWHPLAITNLGVHDERGAVWLWLITACRLSTTKGWNALAFSFAIRRRWECVESCMYRAFRTKVTKETCRIATQWASYIEMHEDPNRYRGVIKRFQRIAAYPQRHAFLMATFSGLVNDPETNPVISSFIKNRLYDRNMLKLIFQFSEHQVNDDDST
jgi:hypothetical protein